MGLKIVWGVISSFHISIGWLLNHQNLVDEHRCENMSWNRSIIFLRSTSHLLISWGWICRKIILRGKRVVDLYGRNRLSMVIRISQGWKIGQSRTSLVSSIGLLRSFPPGSFPIGLRGLFRKGLGFNRIPRKWKKLRRRGCILISRRLLSWPAWD